MAPKKAKKVISHNTGKKSKKEFKFIKGCKELVLDPFNLN
jgi:hypothetical protein